MCSQHYVANNPEQNEGVPLQSAPPYSYQNLFYDVIVGTLLSTMV